MSGLLVVTAVPAEAEAVRAGLTDSTVTVAPVGVGPAVAGAATARLLALAEAAGRPYRAVVSAGIAGGFAGRVAVGGTVLATRSVAADLGAESPDGFLPIEELGMSAELLGVGSVVPADPALLATLRAALPDATTGAVLTVSTVTGTADSTAALAARHPDAVAEAMEGYGVAVAAAQANLPFAELRTVSNPIGPRDRGAWRMREAFAALTAAASALR
ncbi:MULTISPECIES: futalosine hydrolase [Micromonospora]|uniref:Futalosine hydrolase n=1 Tax=Micromonospora solifontis TaxID=2487138 RepID=A0ABX9W8Q3_9ACTN|nr:MULTISPECIES: futalosine hydrolase [Micromonospora]NES17254.1 futalosine hydrolase [Micromonospora sp. PPF5-17B]NES39596.1 futalosine hydrolase [Micromonospora solifontis]NES59070.1 futalosine hydrolase [Micromonospora sp. PPF5-6]RNL88028.1 futalosine hydrolase [Micromonospora solifontis]